MNNDLKNPKWTGVVKADLTKLKSNFAEIKNASKPRRTFYGSMTDLFHESLEVESDERKALADEVKGLDGNCKADHGDDLDQRPQKLLDWQQHYFPQGLPKEVWVGATIEDQAS